MRPPRRLARELWLAVKFAGVCLVGFAVDAGGLWGWMRLGESKDVARLLALVIALQVTFVLTRWLVFESHEPGTFGRQWWRYMVANSFGGLCNFVFFEALTHSRWREVSGPWVALVLSASTAFFINYAGTRLFVYGRQRADPAVRVRGTPPVLPRT